MEIVPLCHYVVNTTLSKVDKILPKKIVPILTALKPFHKVTVT